MYERKLISNEEYYNLLKNDLPELIEKSKKDNNKLKILGSYCSSKVEKNGIRVYTNFQKVNDSLQKPLNIKSFVKVLEILFGIKFFDEIDEETLAKLKENNMFTKDNLDDLLCKVYGNKYGFNFSRPSNYYEFSEFISNCYKVYNDPNIDRKSKENYLNIVCAINRQIERRFNNIIQTNNQENFVIDMYTRFIKAYEKGNPVVINDEEKKKTLEILNKIESIFFVQEENEDKTIGTGEAFLLVVEAYNEELELLYKKEKEDKENHKANKKVDKYYKKITKTPIDKLEVKNFPKYSNENYLQIIDTLIKKLENDKLWDYVTLCYLNYMDYFKSSYYKDNEKLKKGVSK